ncbi:MAG: alpha/beta hydrolase [Firmicutes bacterium]|nr:alpha/beta hydrolase [Bacillota bacterium]
METRLVGKNAKKMLLENGVELEYCEFGEENEEVLVMGYFYYHSILPMVEELAKKYHVYGIVLRMDGKGTQFAADGTIHWANQWGEDVYLFCKTLGLESINYFGKCHGVIPGWWMVKNHPEMLGCFASTFMVPHIKGGMPVRWMQNAGLSPEETVRNTMRRVDKAYIKANEIQKLNAGIGGQAGQSVANSPSMAIAARYSGCPEVIWDSIEECREDLANTDIPVLLMYATEDILFMDYEESNFECAKVIKNAKTVILQGEKHLFEIDCSERFASEVSFFFDECKKNYE